MPVVSVFNQLKSPPTNAFGLVQYLSQRVPGYDPSEHLRELNSAYIHVWEEVSKLENYYFTNIKTVSVVTPQFHFDLQYNSDNALSGNISSRLYQVSKIRVQPPSGGLFVTTTALTPIHPDFTSLNANPTSAPSQTGPYYWYLSGRNQLNFAMPLAAGTQIEVTYSFWPIALTYLFGGTVSSTTNTVTGAGTSFTNLVQPDFTSFQPASFQQEEIQAEVVCNPTVALGGQIYRVTTIPNDTTLTTQTAISPSLAAGSPYVLATLPEIPREHIRVIASVALAAMYSVAKDDARSAEWVAKSTANMQMMKDALIQRQQQTPPQKQRFPYGVGRRNRLFIR
jgi:hypothetical protein